MRDTFGNLEVGTKMRTVQKFWMKFICYLYSSIISDPSKAQAISVNKVSPFFRGEGSDESPLTHPIIIIKSIACT